MPDPYGRLMQPNTSLPEWQRFEGLEDGGGSSMPDFGPMMGMLKQKIGAQQSTKKSSGNMAMGKAMEPAGGGMESL